MLYIFLAVLSTIFGCMGEEARYEDIGCFKDRAKSRALPKLLHNYRGEIDWKNDWPRTDRVIRRCAELASQKGYLYFGIQFYGECWSGPGAEKTFYKYGKSKRCINGVGKGCANKVYMIVDTGRENCSRKKYQILSEHDRQITYKGKKVKCDHPLPPGPPWYRYMGEAGNIMAKNPGLKYSCNTISPGWMRGELPDVSDGIVDRQVCFVYHEFGINDSCRYTASISVQNCGHFYVYKLPVTPLCVLRYCSSIKNTLPVNF